MESNNFRGKNTLLPAVPQDDYDVEDEFLLALAAKLRRPFFAASKEELDELKRIALSHGEALCDYLAGGLSPKPETTYVSKSNYYVIKNGPSISLDTGRIFPGGTLERGTGDVVYLWMLFKEVPFNAAVRELTEWCIDFRAKRERHCRSLCRPGLPLNVLKELVWQIFEHNDFIAGEKVLFPKGNGERTAWISVRGLWEIVWSVYGENCRDSHYFASPHGMRDFLDLFCGDRCPGRFEIRQRYWPKGVLLEEARTIEYSFVPTDYPLRF